MKGLDWVLVGWSVLALGWWVTALVLLARGCRPGEGIVDPNPVDLTLFKPLPPVSDDVARDRIGRAVNSFAVQLDDRSTLRVGVDLAAAASWRGWVEVWTAAGGRGRTRTLVSEPPRRHANPKIAWLERLAADAPSGLWLWSDADVIAPPGLLRELRTRLRVSGAGAVTCAYCVRDVTRAAYALDALFVNLEFLPGALLLGGRGSLPFAFGAAVLFESSALQARVSWDELGRELADDYTLGRALAPVTLSGVLVETVPTVTRLAEALKHYYRWQKTVRWCRPGGYAALLVLLPLGGWILRCLWGPAPHGAAAGAAVVWAAEVATALLAFRILGCAMGGLSWLVTVFWPVIRLLAWLAVWLPLPVEWQGRDPLWRRRRKRA